MNEQKENNAQYAENIKKTKPFHERLFFQVILMVAVVALLLLSYAAVYAVKVWEKSLDMRKTQNSQYRTDTVPGKKIKPHSIEIFNVEKDSEMIKKTAPLYEKRYESFMARGKKNPDNGDSAELIRKKNNFAASRLELLKKLDSATTHEEREKIIKNANDKQQK